MAATDQTYRRQRTLDVVFGVTCVLMLASIVWMFYQDYHREFKAEQREFRDVEEALAERQMLGLVPNQQQLDQIKRTEEDLAQKRAVRDQGAEDVEKQTRGWQIDRTKTEADAKAAKADLDSVVSLYDLAVENRNRESPGSGRYQTLDKEVNSLKKQIDALKKKWGDAQDKIDDLTADIEKAKSGQKELDKDVAKAEARLKEQTADFERFARLAVQKRWKTGDWFRSLPVIDAFNSPTRIQQYTLRDLPIDYNFMHVTRYDRCTTCHLGIGQPAYTQKALRDLGEQPSAALMSWLNNQSEDANALPDDLKEEKLADDVFRLKTARRMLRLRKEILKDSTIDPGDLRWVSVKLNNAQVSEYAAHPRLDLFVDEKSPHPAEKFGCTICHGGQGSATDFQLAAHTPDDYLEKNRWMARHHWEDNRDWEFPMLPQRFLESSCIQCHHQVVDLLPKGELSEYRDGKPVDAAPGSKVVRGYNLVRENGCFGCHEIAGIKNGRAVGPDLRLEPSPPLEDLTPTERQKLTADPLSPPGAMRKIGPSLRRIAEKTHEDWAVKWIRAPRDFRPDTKMPHFYDLSNNNEKALEGTGEAGFPEAEVHSIAYYLFRKSDGYLTDLKKDVAKYDALGKKPSLGEDDKKERDEISRRYRGQSMQVLIDPNLPQGYKEDKARGRQLFSEKGCLACHSHAATAQAGMGLPAVKGEQNFGPNLSRLREKLGTKLHDTASARRWLVQWIKDPKVYHPRTFMPITHLDDAEASDVAAWLLDPKVSQPWDNPPEVPEPKDQTLYDLAKAYLGKSTTPRELREIFPENGTPSAEKLQGILDAEDRPMGEKLDARGKVKLYVGKKAINQLGCFACHDIPGFESAKPIGTPLNDWGRKDAERLAFEDASAFVEENNYIVDQTTDEQGHGVGPNDKNQQPYERYFKDALDRHQRDGFLNQKLRYPRSFDYERIRAWDDRLRMPQFKFSRGAAKPVAGETQEQADARAEAEARDAVMTFVLGLVAEPIPLSYVYEPPPERAAIVKGTKVLDKYNCAGCHQLRAGIYEFSTKKPGGGTEDKVNPVMEELERKYKDSTNRNNISYQADYALQFKPHNAWQGRPSAFPDRVVAHALPQSKVPGVPEAGEDVRIRLTEALRFTKKKEDMSAEDRNQLAPDTYDIPAAVDLKVPRDQLLFQADRHGGTFAELLVPYLMQRDSSRFSAADPGFKDSPSARSALPPPLLREGEKVQPSWLFQFIKNPYKMRTATILRMPRFHMSDEEAMALVSYFAAVDKADNPDIDLDAPYVAIKQRDEGFLDEQSQQYAQRLTRAELNQRIQALKAPAKGEPSIWDRLLKKETEDLSLEVQQAAKDVENATGPDKDRAREKYNRLKKDLEVLNGKGHDAEKQDLVLNEWKQHDIYASDAYRLLTNKQACLQCHQVGSLLEPGPIGPRLDDVWQRLRPGWTRLWLASPQRLLVYPLGNNPMPQALPADKKQYEDLFVGIEAARFARAEKLFKDANTRLDKAEKDLKDADKRLDKAIAAESEGDRRKAEKDRATAQKAIAKATQDRDDARLVIAQYPLNQVTAIRDILMIYPKVADMPENRYYRPLAQAGEK